MQNLRRIVLAPFRNAMVSSLSGRIVTPRRLRFALWKSYAFGNFARGSQSPARPVELPGAVAVRDAEHAVRDAMLHGTPGQRKALLKELVVEVRVEGRDSIIPTFRLPTTSVRVTEAVVVGGGLEPSTSWM